MDVYGYIFRLNPTQPSHTFAYLKEADGRWYPYDKLHQVLAHRPVFDYIQAKYSLAERLPTVVRQGGLYGIIDEIGDLVVPVVHLMIELENGVYVCTKQCQDGSLYYEYYDERGVLSNFQHSKNCFFRSNTRQRVVWVNVYEGALLLQDSSNDYTLAMHSRYPWKQPVTKFTNILFLSTGGPPSCVPYQGQTMLSIDKRIFTLAVTDFLQPGDLISAFSAQWHYYYLRVQRGKQYMLLWQDGTPLLLDWVDSVVPFGQILHDDCTVTHMALVVQCLQTTVVHLPVTVVE